MTMQNIIQDLVEYKNFLEFEVCITRPEDEKRIIREYQLEDGKIYIVRK